MPREQSYANHKRYLPLYHFIVVPLFVVNLSSPPWRCSSSSGRRG